MEQERIWTTKVVVKSPLHELTVTDRGHGVDSFFHKMCKKYNARDEYESPQVLVNGDPGILATFCLETEKDFISFLEDYVAYAQEMVRHA